MRAHDRVRRGAALPGVLIVMLWLTGISGWLVAHTVWDQRIVAVDDRSSALGQGADAMGHVATRMVGGLADWGMVTTPGPALPCPGGGPPLPPAIDPLAETTSLQATTDVLSRWDAAARPAWRYLTACQAEALQGIWRWRVPAPWLLVWASDVPDGVAIGGPDPQLVLHVVALWPEGGRAARTITLRRHAGETWARIVAWRGE
jgi:hypothetical protein